MRIITFQHPEVLKTLRKNNKYTCVTVSKYNEATPKCYERLRTELESKINQKVQSIIFAWGRVSDEYTIDISQAERMLEMTHFINYIALELDVPDEMILLTRFYDFVDIRCEEEGIDNYDWESDGRYSSYDEFIESCWQRVLNNHEDCEIQVILPYIQSDWLVRAYSVKKNSAGVYEYRNI